MHRIIMGHNNVLFTQIYNGMSVLGGDLNGKVR